MLIGNYVCIIQTRVTLYSDKSRSHWRSDALDGKSKYINTEPAHALEFLKTVSRFEDQTGPRNIIEICGIADETLASNNWKAKSVGIIVLTKFSMCAGPANSVLIVKFEVNPLRGLDFGRANLAIGKQHGP